MKSLGLWILLVTLCGWTTVVHAQSRIVVTEIPSDDQTQEKVAESVIPVLVMGSRAAGSLKIMKFTTLNYELFPMGMNRQGMKVSFLLNKIPLQGIAHINWNRQGDFTALAFHHLQGKSGTLGKKVDLEFDVSDAIQMSMDGSIHEQMIAVMLPTIEPALKIKLKHSDVRIGYMIGDAVFLNRGEVDNGIMQAATIRWNFH